MVILNLSIVDKKTQNPLELVSYLSFLIPLQASTKTQFKWPKRLAQLDNQLYIKRETYIIFKCMELNEIVCM